MAENTVTVDAADVLAILEERPYLEDELVEMFEVPWNVLRVVLKNLSTAGQVKRVGTERRWALSSYRAPVARPHLEKPARAQRELEDVDEDLDEAIAADAEDLDVAAVDDEELPVDEPIEELVPPRNREKLLGTGGRRLYPAGTRQEPVKKLRVAEQPAWWVQFAAPDQRDAFRTAAAARDAEMQKSPGWRSQTKVNQEPRG